MQAQSSGDVGDNTFLYDNWYIAGISGDVTSKPVSQRICGIPVVFFRTESGVPVALEDRCPHRGMMISAGGECFGEKIRCPYHGLEFETDGRCSRIPGLERVSPEMRMRSFPVVEQDSVIWIWMGNPKMAEPSAVPSHPYHSTEAYVWCRGALDIDANWEFLNDNLLDLTHVQYAHRNTIGGDPEEDARAEVKVERLGSKVRLTRVLRDTPCPPFHRTLYGFKGNIDRVQEVEFTPGYIFLHSSSMEVGDSRDEGWRDRGMHFYQTHAITPKTATSTCYMFTMSRSFLTDDEELTQKIYDLSLRTFEEDKAMLEAQQERCLEYPDEPLVATRHDTATAQARRIVRELMVAQSAGSRMANTPIASAAE